MTTHPQLLSMQQIADLTRVQRPVVSMWRKRYVAAPHPFPSPAEGTDPLRFNADEVAAWLRVTGLGNNSEAPDDALLHSSLFHEALDSPERFCPLLLAHALLGEEIGLDALPDIELALMENGYDPGATRVADLLADTPLVQCVNALAEASFSSAHVLSKLAQHECSANGRLAHHALTSNAGMLLGRIVTECLRALEPCTLGVHTRGAMSLAQAALTHLSDDEMPFVWSHGVATDESATWFAALARGATTQAPDGSPHLHLWADVTATPADATTVFSKLSELLLDVNESDVAVVVAPSNVLIDALPPAEHSARVAFLTNPYHPVRYLARLPKGMCATGGRRQLALMVLQPQPRNNQPGAGADMTSDPKPVTMFGEHTHHDFSSDEIDRICGDVVACITGQRSARSFWRSRQTYTANLPSLLSLAIEARCLPPASGGDVLAQVWELQGMVSPGLLDGIHLSAREVPQPDPGKPWPELVGTYVRVIAGTKGLEPYLQTGPDGLAVLGEADVRAERPIGSLRINQVTLARQAPRAERTRPGDVVFVSRGGPRAIVDPLGGRVVLAPARILRARYDMEGTFSPYALAHDICAQPGGETSAWRIRLSPSTNTVAAEVDERIVRRRTELLAELRALDELAFTIGDALASGTLARAPDE